MKKNVNKICLNYFLRSKTVFAIFDIKKNTLQILSLNFIFDNCSLMQDNGFWKFPKKIFIFKVSVFFWKCHMVAIANISLVSYIILQSILWDTIVAHREWL